MLSVCPDLFLTGAEEIEIFSSQTLSCYIFLSETLSGVGDTYDDMNKMAF